MRATTQLTTLLKQEQALQVQKQKAINQRKKEISNLIEKHDLLVVSNAIFEGLFLQLKTMLEQHHPQLNEWDMQFHRGSAQRKKAQTHLHSAESDDSAV